MALTFCLAEDRIAEDTALRLVLLSLRKHQPEATVFLFRPQPSSSFREWLRTFPSVVLVPHFPEGALGWNCKPQVLLDVLDRNCDGVVWLDSDILVTRGCDLLLNGHDEAIVVARESACIPYQGSAVRTEGWQLPPGRTFPRTMNSCVLRVTQSHRPLLVRWVELLKNPEYLAAQNMASYNRPPHFGGDQDALNALLGSAEFSNVPVRELDERYVIHTGGARTYPLGHRLAGLFRRIPPFVHSSGPKPWIVLNPRNKGLTGRFWALQRIILEASPYTAVAKKYERWLGTDSTWMRYSSPAGRILRLLGCGHYALRGMPLALIAATISFFDRIARRVREETVSWHARQKCE